MYGTQLISGRFMTKIQCSWLTNQDFFLFRYICDSFIFIYFFKFHYIQG